MICEENIEIVHSSLIGDTVYSEEDPDYRTLDVFLRLTEDNAPRETENDEFRTLES